MANEAQTGFCFAEKNYNKETASHGNRSNTKASESVLAIDVAARARMPSLSEMGLEMVGREVAHAVMGVALFGERKILIKSSA